MKKISRVARVYGRLLVLREDDCGNGWVCQCRCGNVITVRDTEIVSDGDKPCECSYVPGLPVSSTLRRDNLAEYGVWSGMKTRCYNQKHGDFRYYGARGITVCEKWRNNFAAFLVDMGKRPGPEYSIDRMDSAGPYSPENCRWTIQYHQIANRRCYVKPGRKSRQEI